ncbi:hypothetical protein G6011_01878 [Alternaria panax]|uniref:Uncharacterized protein n=1 Tax=Alternaria panax TaxID=48097 RepID=A0AAD4FEK5_9PLEO|nr:hypothetical protein G6011_01878 [Alternaria panax]
MHALQNVVGLFSSPAKATPGRPGPVKATAARKRNYGDMSTMRSLEKRKRASYDPSEYQTAVYGGARTMTLNDEEGDKDEEEESELENEEDEDARAAEQLLQDQLRLESQLCHFTHTRHPTATPKSPRRATRAISSALEPETRSGGGEALQQALASHVRLYETEVLSSTEADSEAEREKLATIQQAKAENGGVVGKVEVERYVAARGEVVRKKVEGNTFLRFVGGGGDEDWDEGVVSVGGESESGDEEDEEEEEEGIMQETFDNVDLDWSDEDPIISSATPHRHLHTLHEKPPSTTAIQLSPTTGQAHRLKHSPVTKQPRSHTTATTTTTFKLPENYTLPADWPTLTPSQRWSTDSHLRARELHYNPRLIRAELPDEPAYAFRDTEIRDGICGVREGIERFARMWFAGGAHASYVSSSNGEGDGGDGEENRDMVVDETFYEGLSPETARVIACVASGGPSGIWGWHEIFINGEKLQALVCGIIGNVISEQVFRHAFFGGTEEGIRAVREVEVQHREDDGFTRKPLYTSAMLSHLPSPTSLPENFTTHVNVIIGALWTHLSPLLALVHPHPTTPSLPTISPALHTLAVTAGLVSLHMALSPHTIYHHVPLFKEDSYTSATMSCFNKRSMRTRNMQTPISAFSARSSDADADTDADTDADAEFKPTPAELRRETTRRATLPSAEKKRACGDTALTQIVCMQGITAYRRGGWENASSSALERPVYEKAEYAHQGLRARMLTRGWTYCRWGRARSSVQSSVRKLAPGVADGDGATSKKVHGGAWREGGFVNFSDVEGVVDWLGMEKRDREERARGWWAERMEREVGGRDEKDEREVDGQAEKRKKEKAKARAKAKVKAPVVEST